MAVQRECRILLFIQLADSCGTILDHIKDMPAHILRRQTAVCMIVVEIPYKIRSLYAGRDVRAALVGGNGSDRGFRLNTVSPFERCMLGCAAENSTARMIVEYPTDRQLIRKRCFSRYYVWSAGPLARVAPKVDELCS